MPSKTFKNVYSWRAHWHRYLIPAFSRQPKEHLCELEASFFVCIASSKWCCFKTNKQEQQEEFRDEADSLAMVLVTETVSLCVILWFSSCLYSSPHLKSFLLSLVPCSSVKLMSYLSERTLTCSTRAILLFPATSRISVLSRSMRIGL